MGSWFRSALLLMAVFLGAILFVTSFDVLGLYLWGSARFSDAMHESQRRMDEIAEAASFELRERQREGETEPLPLFDTYARGKKMYCPIVDYVTEGRLKVPLAVTYAVKRRDDEQWQALNPNKNPVVPFVFPLRLVPVGWFKYGTGVVCYSDRSQSEESYLPSLSGPCFPHLTREDGKLQGYVDIYFDQADRRFPFATEIHAIRAQVDYGVGDRDKKSR